jgi:hydroxyacylglutathione hydrolase
MHFVPLPIRAGTGTLHTLAIERQKTMPLQIETIPCLRDNYAYLAHDPSSGETALIDIPQARPVLDRLAQTGWTLTHILITHHHPDHIQGIDEVRAKHPAAVYGNAADAGRLPPLTHALSDGDTITIGSEQGVMFDVSGHTIGHVAFHFPDSAAAFTADSLMALGCGRVFEGTKPQMHASLQRIAALPADTMIYTGHEYTVANAAFAETIDPSNTALTARIAAVKAARAQNKPTVPVPLSEELATNPFLRAHDPAIQANLGMEGADPVDVFAEIRSRKDNF